MNFASSDIRSDPVLGIVTRNPWKDYWRYELERESAINNRRARVFV